jgi:antibiotic biosynthesis monooxygenase (ABM) superfamily enzyme
MTQRSKNIGLRSSSPSQPSNCDAEKNESHNAPPINQHVMAVTTFLALLPLVYFVPDLVAQFLPAIKWLNVTVTVAIIVPIISYVVLPAARLVLSRGIRVRKR